MATQRITIAKIAGRAAAAVRERFAAWAAVPDLAAANSFAARLREEAHVPPVLFFAEYIDLWSMGDLLHDELRPLADIVAICGGRFEQFCCPLPLRDGFQQLKDKTQFDEQQWFRQFIAEAAKAWEPMCGPAVLVLLREVLGATVTDEEVRGGLERVPTWIGGG